MGDTRAQVVRMEAGWMIDFETWQAGDVTLYNADCLAVLPTLPAGSIDAIITDLPYGTTACSWDVVIPFAPMWAAVKHVLKPRGVFVTTASQPFTSALVMSNVDWFKYEWVWNKGGITGYLDANRKPLKRHENLLIFSQNGHKYNPIMTSGMSYKKKRSSNPPHYGQHERQSKSYGNERYPTTILYISHVAEKGIDHPTQKPVALYKYLILTYTDSGETVLDMCMGSGSCGVAAVELGRKFIGIDNDTEHGYFEIAVKRISQAQLQMRLPMEVG